MSILKTAFEIAKAKSQLPINFIPAITVENEKYWNQPERSQIILDGKNAVMDKKTFDQLADYSCSLPTGVYPGKMWKGRKDYHDESKGWFLFWFGIHPTEPEKFCSTNKREILVIDA